MTATTNDSNDSDSENDCDSDNGSDNSMISVAISASRSLGAGVISDPWICLYKGPPVRTRGCEHERSVRPTSDEPSADADRPCHRWPIQQWVCLVRRTLGWRPPTRRCQKKRRDRATRAAIKQEVSRFLEGAEGASRVAEQSEKTKAPQHGRRSSAQARRLLAPLSRGGHATLRSTSMAPRPTRRSVWNVPAAAEHGQPAAAEHGRTSLQRYMRTFGFGEPLEIRDGKTMLHYLARQSEVAAEGNTVLAAWFELLQVYCLRRPASWLEFAILVEAPRLPVGWTALDILANSYADVAPRMVQQLLEAGAELSPRSRARSTRPLHAALRNGNGEVVDILLAAKADPHARTQLGFSCADLAPTPTLKELFRNLGVGADETDPDPAPPSRAKPAPPRAPSSYGAQPATPPPPPPTSSRDAAPSQQAATNQQIGNRPHELVD